jgi:hypothetical protein
LNKGEISLEEAHFSWSSTENELHNLKSPDILQAALA